LVNVFQDKTNNINTIDNKNFFIFLPFWIFANLLFIMTHKQAKSLKNIQKKLKIFCFIYNLLNGTEQKDKHRLRRGIQNTDEMAFCSF